MTSFGTFFFAVLMFSESVLAATPVFVLFDDGGEHIPEACTKESTRGITTSKILSLATRRSEK